MSRDWQKDMELCEQAKDWEFYLTFDGCGDIEENGSTIASGVGVSQAGTIFDALEALPYWLQQYAAEKERGDKAEEREKVLKHAFIVMLGYVPKTARVALDFDEVLASLYPKEETKPTVLEEEETNE